jgi:hypothetical protein
MPFSTSPAVNRAPSAKPHSLAICFSFSSFSSFSGRLPHHSALYQSASSTPIGDRNRSGLFGLRFTSHDDHRNATLRTYGPGLQFARKLNDVMSLLGSSHPRRLQISETLSRPMTFPRKLGQRLILSSIQTGKEPAQGTAMRARHREEGQRGPLSGPAPHARLRGRPGTRCRADGACVLGARHLR